MIRPRASSARPLPDGGTIGVAAPASPYESRSDVLRSVEWWEAQGYRVKLGEHVLAQDDFVAGDPRDRAADLMAMFADPEVDVVQCLQGGYGSAQLIPHLDFDAIAANPKPFVGFSDITALHVAVRQRTGLATFYGNGFLGMGAAGDERVLEGAAPGRAAGRRRRRGAERTRTTPTCARSRAGRSPRRSSAAASGCSCRRWATPWEIDARRRDPLLRGHAPPDLLPGRHPHPARACRQTRRRPRSRSRRDGEVRLGRPPGRVAADAVARGRARGSPGAAGRSRAIQASLGAREAPRDHPARRHGDARCGREDAHDRGVRPGDGGEGV